MGLESVWGDGSSRPAIGEILLQEVKKGFAAKSSYLRDELKKPSMNRVTRLYLAMLNGIEVGFASLDRHISEGTLVIYSLNVGPSFRSQGIAQALLVAIEALARADGYFRMRLKPHPTEKTTDLVRLKALYHRAGFRPMNKSDHWDKRIGNAGAKGGV